MSERLPGNILFSEALSVWWRIGLLSFGGPAGQIALMHSVIVEEKKWLNEERFLHALNYCMLLPGPEAQQLASYIGWLLHGVKGGLVAGCLFILPGAVAMLGLAWVYVLLGDFSLVEGLFFGLKAAVLAIVVQAMLRIAQRTLTGRLKPLIAALAFLGLFIAGLPFPIVVLVAGVLGWLTAHSLMPGASPHNSQSPSDTRHVSSSRVRSAQLAAAICALLWLLTVAVLWLWRGESDVFTELALFFSKMAVVTFGGAYAVLAYVAQQGVEHFQWLQPGEMLDGLGLAETTPGPLILVTQFVGYLAAFRQSGLESALLAGTLGALLTTWVTFLPCFVWIFAGAPFVESLRGNQKLSAALAAVTAAVVGVIANLALWFAINVLFSQTRREGGDVIDILVPVLSSIDLSMLILCVMAFVMIFMFRWSVIKTLGVMAIAGAVSQQLLI
ncbi:chromate efflux transporter [Gammaproteobacteria bacterium LSUCC0112]|nr:chromate efflux transporter [Gammaproteobacteria bacterium LSUCC0112]